MKLKKSIPQQGYLFLFYFFSFINYILSLSYSDITLRFSDYSTLKSVSLFPSICNQYIKELYSRSVNGVCDMPQNVTKRGYELLLIYYGYSDLEVTVDNCVDLLMTSYAVKEVEVFQKVVDFIKDNMNMKLCKILMELNITNNNDFKSINECINNHISDNGYNLLNDGILLYLDAYLQYPIPIIHKIVSSENLIIPDESYLFNKLYNYYYHNYKLCSDKKTFINYMKELFYHIQFKKVNPENIGVLHESQIMDGNDMLSIYQLNSSKKDNTPPFIKHDRISYVFTKNKTFDDIVIYYLKNYSSTLSISRIYILIF